MRVTFSRARVSHSTVNRSYYQIKYNRIKWNKVDGFEATQVLYKKKTTGLGGKGEITLELNNNLSRCLFCSCLAKYI